MVSRNKTTVEWYTPNRTSAKHILVSNTNAMNVIAKFVTIATFCKTSVYGWPGHNSFPKSKWIGSLLFCRLQFLSRINKTIPHNYKIALREYRFNLSNVSLSACINLLPTSITYTLDLNNNKNCQNNTHIFHFNLRFFFLLFIVLRCSYKWISARYLLFNDCFLCVNKIPHATHSSAQLSIDVQFRTHIVPHIPFGCFHFFPITRFHQLLAHNKWIR